MEKRPDTRLDRKAILLFRSDGARRYLASIWPILLAIVSTSTVLNFADIGIAADVSQKPPAALADGGSGFTPEEDASFERGSTAYFQLCHVCHGPDGAGATILDDPLGRRMAPSLSKSPRVVGRPEYVITALLAGVTGPVDDENYQGQMVSMASYGDAWIADVASFIRGSFDNDASMITSNQVARIRKKLVDEPKLLPSKKSKPCCRSR